MAFFVLLNLLPINSLEVPLEILIVTDGSSHSPWISSFESGIIDRLNDLKTSHLLNSEYMDLGTFPLTQQIELSREILSRKYQTRQPDYSVFVGPVACQFSQMNKDLIVNKLTIGIGNDEQKETFGEFISLAHDYEKMVDEIVRLTNPQQVYVVTNSNNALFERQSAPLLSILKEKKLKTIILDGKALPEILTKISSLPESSVLFWMPIPLETDSQKIPPREFIKQICLASTSPVFSSSANEIEMGTVGGYVSSPYILGQSIGEIIYNKENDLQVINSEITTRSYVYNYSALKRWGIDVKLPSGAKIIHSGFVLDKSNAIILFGALIAIVIISTLILVKKRNMKNVQNEGVKKIPFNQLSKREMEILKGIYEGKTIKELSFDLEISDRTVSTYKSRLLNKLNLKTTSELIRYTAQFEDSLDPGLRKTL